MSINVSKEWAYNANSKYINFIKFSITHKRLRAWENLPDFWKRGETSPTSEIILMKITPSDSAYQKTLLHRFQAHICKNLQLCIFCQKKDHGGVFIFFSGVIVPTHWPYKIKRELIRSSILSVKKPVFLFIFWTFLN